MPGRASSSRTTAGTNTSKPNACVERYVNPAAKGVDVHAAIASDNASAVTTSITNPAIPRSLQVVFAASWDGGDITIVGTDQFDAAVTEVIPDTANSTVEGVKIFKTVTSISNETVGTGGSRTATVQTGPKIGLLQSLVGEYGTLATNDAMEAATWDATYSAFTPTTAPNGTNDYTVVHNTTHTHSLT